MKNKTILTLVIINLVFTIFIASYLIFSNTNLNQSVNNCYMCNDEEIDMIGYVTDIDKINGGIVMLVEDSLQNFQYDKVYVTVKEDATIIKTVYSRTFNPDIINVGDKVKVIFDGPVAESYPAQGTASFVWIIESEIK